MGSEKDAGDLVLKALDEFRDVDKQRDFALAQYQHNISQVLKQHEDRLAAIEERLCSDVDVRGHMLERVQRLEGTVYVPDREQYSASSRDLDKLTQTVTEFCAKVENNEKALLPVWAKFASLEDSITARFGGLCLQLDQLAEALRPPQAFTPTPKHEPDPQVVESQNLPECVLCKSDKWSLMVFWKGAFACPGCHLTAWSKR